MSYIIRIHCIAVTLLLALNINAQSVIWNIDPQYKSIKPYAYNLYLYKVSNKWGLMNSDGKKILSPIYDFIFLQENGTGLFGINEGSSKRYRLKGIIHSNGSYILIKEKLYVIPKYLDFHEGKLCVANESNKQGFINENGEIVVKCQFDVVRPFCEGLASVKMGSWVFYIRDDYDYKKYNAVYSEWRNGYVTRGSSFKNGKAVVGYNGKYKIIDKAGHEIDDFYASNWKINEKDYTIADPNVTPSVKDKQDIYYSPIEIIEKNGKYGLAINNTVILEPILDKVLPVDTNNISIASHNGKYGLLKVIDTPVKADLLFNDNQASSIYIDSKGIIDTLQYRITIPQEYIGNIQFNIDRGYGVMENVTDQLEQHANNTLVYNFVPYIGISDINIDLKCQLQYKGLEVYNKSYALPLIPMILKIDGPRTITAQADITTEIQEITARIYNESDRDVYITATMSVNCKLNKAVSRTFKLSLPKNSSKSITIPVTVQNDENVSAFVNLSTGEHKSTTVALRIY